MKKRSIRIILPLLVLWMSLSVFAQSDDKKPSNDNKKWYASLGAGPNILFGNQDGKAPSFGNRIRMGGEISVGRWINPVFGLRAQLYFGQYRGFNYVNPQWGYFLHGNGKTSFFPLGWPDVNYSSDKTGFWQEFYSESLSLDATFNLSRLILKSDASNKPVEVIGYVGVAYLHNIQCNTAPTYDGFGGRFGGRINFKLGKETPWKLYLEGQSWITSEEFDGYIGTENFNATVNILIGAQYSF